MKLMKREMPTLTRRPLWSEEDVDRHFGELVRRMFGGSPWFGTFAELTGSIPVEEYVDDSTLVIRAEIAGVDPDKDIDITVTDGLLTVHARRTERSEETRDDTYRSEFRYGEFSRSLRLPDGVTDSDVKASYTDGVLEIRVPMPATTTATPTVIPVTHA